MGDRGLEKADFVFLVHWDDFTAYKLREKRWKPENASNGQSSRNLLEAFEPALKLSKITRVLTANFRKSLMKLPRGYDKLKAFRDLSFNRKIARAIELDLKDKDLLSTKTANKHFGNIIE